MIQCDIIGVNELIADFKGYEKEVDKAISLAVSDTANAVVKDAKNRLNTGLQSNPKHRRNNRLINSIMRKKSLEQDQFEAVVGTDVKYAPYIEFGTGDLVEIPEGAEEVAATYKGAGIRKVNIKAVSFLNYSAVKNEKTFLKKLEDRLNAIIK
jgi:phage gpG-like protein